MTHIPTRRSLIIGSGSTALALALAACTQAQVQAVAAAVVSDTALIANGLKVILPVVAAIVGVPPVTVTLVTTIVSDVATVALQVAQAETQNAAQPLITRLSADVSALLGAVSGLTLPADVHNILMAAEALLPTIQVAVGIVTNLIALPHDAAAQVGPDQARQILAAAAAK